MKKNPPSHGFISCVRVVSGAGQLDNFGGTAQQSVENHSGFGSREISFILVTREGKWALETIAQCQCFFGDDSVSTLGERRDHAEERLAKSVLSDLLDLCQDFADRLAQHLRIVSCL